MQISLLLVEDEQGDVFIMKRALQRAGVTNSLNVVTDGNMAIEYLSGTGEFSDRETYPKPALVFLDLKLPFKSGFEILKWIRSEPAFDDVIVIILSSSDEEKDMQQAYRLGARSFIVKPPNGEQLQTLIQSLANEFPG